MAEHCGTICLDVIEYMMSTYSMVFLLRSATDLICNTIRSKWEPKKNPTPHDVTRRATSLTTLQQGWRNTESPHNHDKTNIQSGNTRPGGGIANKIDWRSSSSVRSSRRMASSNRSSSLSPTMQIWQEQLQHAQESCTPPLSTTSVDHAPFCRFCFLSNHPTPKWSAISPQVCTTLINTCRPSLPSNARRPLWYLSHPYCGHSPPNYGSTPTMPHALNASNMHHPPQPLNLPPNTYVPKASAAPPSPKD